ncbi:MAG: type II secretion system F family protein [Sulfolobales archaeon]
MQYPSKLAVRLAERFSRLERYVVGSGIAPSLSRYFEISIKLYTLSLVLTSTASAVITIQILNLGLLESITITLIVLFLMTSLFILAVLILPKLLHANRGYKLEAKYPTLLYIFSSLVVSGLGPTKALLELNNFEDLKEFKVELDQISNGLYLGKSLDDITSYLILITPCRSLASLLMIIGSIVRSGRDPLSAVNYLIENYFTTLRARVEEVVNFMSMLSEAFIAIALIFPLIISIISSTTSLLPSGVASPYLLLVITSLVLVPASSIVYYILVDYLMSSVYI